MTPTILALGYCGSIAAALAMDRHHQQIFGRRACVRDAVALRLVGGVIFLCALASALASPSASIGVVEFIVAASVGALLSAVSLAYAPRFAAAVAVAAAPIAIVSMILNVT